MKIQAKLSLLTISTTVVSVFIALFIATNVMHDAQVQDATDKLSTVLEARHSALVHHLEVTHKQMHVLAAAPTTLKSLAALGEAYAKLGDNAQVLLQQKYLGQKQLAAKAAASKDSDYDRALALAAPYFLRLHDTYNWQDMFLIDPRGNVVFSIAREEDYATNLLTGPWKDTGLARAVTPLLRDPVPGAMSFSDFSRYAPSSNLPAAFLAMPVFDAVKQVFLGVVALQLPVKHINELMHDLTGLGESGETFIVGQDGWMLTDSRFRKESSILGVQLKTAAVSLVLAGESGIKQLRDYRNVEVYVSYKPLQPFRDEAVLGEHPLWGVIAKIDKSEVLAEFYQLRWLLLLTGGGLLLFALAAGTLGSRGITRPLLRIKEALVQLADNQPADVPCLEMRDEIGEMAKAAEAFRKIAQQIDREHWISEHVLALTKEVSTETNLSKAADRVLHLLCDRLEVPVGAIYLLDEGAYRRVGAHGMARRSQVCDSFKLGEGVLGQCASDNQALVLSPVPSGLAIISTGLAEFPPHELVLYPIAYKEEVLVLLELAAVKTLEPRHHEFLKAASAALGLHFANLQTSEHNLMLLEETTKQSAVLKEQQDELLRSNEELHALTEELRSQSEEMKAQNEELRANQEELRAQQEEMKHKNLMLETQSAQLKELLHETESKAQELQRANQYKSEFLANMSHELRTPLNSVLILSKNLAENQESNLSPEQIESATVISESGAQLLTLINDILDLSRIEAGKLELVRENFRLDDMLAYLRRIFSPQAEKKQLAFKIRVAADLPELICTDRQRLTQVLSNLLSNAVKFTDSGEVEVLVSKLGQDLQFEVSDTGIGIEAGKLEHIFGAFQQADGSTSRKYGGSGLGLAISRHLSELLGGTVQVQSRPGLGSRFTLRLHKLFAAQQTAVQTRTEAPVTAAAGSLLIVEDDTRLLSILERMIKAQGFAPLTANSAEQALQALEQALPMGILLDLGLPKMSGMELLRHLKKDKKTAQIPVYIMSGAADSGEARILGALGFLKKPVTRDTIAAAIKAMASTLPAKPEKRLLLIDPDPTDQQLIAALFAGDSVALSTANSGNEALQLLQAQPYDSVVLALELPDMSGFDWLKMAAHKLNPPPVVIFSARELSEAEVFELKGVAESIVIKGSSNRRLHEEVLHALHLDSSKLPPAATLPEGGKKLLLVDDDARNLFALTKVLRSKGYIVTVAQDGAKALQMLAQDQFDAILTDIMMPEMDGYALIRQIRAQGYTGIPIFAITAKAMQGDAELCLQAGATAYLAKPVDVDRLIEMIGQS